MNVSTHSANSTTVLQRLASTFTRCKHCEDSEYAPKLRGTEIEVQDGLTRL